MTRGDSAFVTERNTDGNHSSMMSIPSGSRSRLKLVHRVATPLLLITTTFLLLTPDKEKSSFSLTSTLPEYHYQNETATLGFSPPRHNSSFISELYLQLATLNLVYHNLLKILSVMTLTKESDRRFFHFVDSLVARSQEGLSTIEIC